MARGFTPGVIAFVVGLIGAFLGAYQVGPEYAVIGPIGAWFGGDLGFELGTILAGSAFYLLRRREVRRGARVAEATPERLAS